MVLASQNAVLIVGGILTMHEVVLPKHCVVQFATLDVRLLHQSLLLQVSRI